MRLSIVSYFVLIVAVIIISAAVPSEAFSVPLSSATRDSQRTCLSRDIPQHRQFQYGKPPTLPLSMLVLQVSKLRDDDVLATDDNGENDEDEELLRQTEKSDMVALCEQFELSTEGTKEELLLRLRTYADTKIEEERQRLEERNKRIEDGSGQNDREKYEIVNSDEEDDDDDDDAFFYFETKSTIPTSTMIAGK